MGKMSRNANWMERLPSFTYLILVLCMAGAVLSSAKAYQGIADRFREGTDIRSAAQFAATKVRQSDFPGGITCSNGSLVCHEYLDSGEEFLDELYYSDGWLMELYQESDAVFYGSDRDAGDRTIACENASFTADGRFILYDIRLHGREVSGSVYVRGGGLDGRSE